MQLVPRLTAEGKITAGSFAGVDAWLRWIPPGLAAHAIQDASDGHPGTALLRLAAAGRRHRRARRGCGSVLSAGPW